MALAKKRRLRLVVFLGLLTALAPMANDMYLPGLPVMGAEFGISASLAQLTLTMTMLGMGIGQIFAGPVSDFLGRRPPLFLGMVMFCLAAAGCVFSESIWLFLLCRFFLGFSGAIGIVTALAIARDVCEGSELTRFFSLLIMLNGLSSILAPVVGGQILLLGTWRHVFAVIFVIGVGLTASVLGFTETLPAARRIADIGRSFHVYPKLLRDRNFFAHCLLQGFVFGAFFAYIGGSSFLFEKFYGVSAQTYSLIFGSVGIGLMLTSWIPAKLAGRVSDSALLRCASYTSFLGSVLLFFLFLADAPMLATLPVLFVTVVPLSVVGAANFSMAMARQGGNAGSASALLGCAQMLLGGVMMPLVGIAGDDTPIPMAVLMMLGYGLGVWCYHKRIAPTRR